MQRCIAQSQGEQRDDLQDLSGVEDPAVANLVVRHVLQDGDEVRQHKDIQSSEVPQQDGHKRADNPLRPEGGWLQRNGAEVVQTGHDHNRPLQSAVDLSEDLNQQTRVVPGHLQAQEEEVSVAVDVNGGEDEGQGCVYNSQGHAEDPHEASADVVPLEKHQGPVEETLHSQTEQDAGDGDVHSVFPGGVFNQMCTTDCSPLWRLCCCFCCGG